MKNDYMTPSEVIESARLGNRVARKLFGANTTRADDAIRHMYNERGEAAAIRLYTDLTGIGTIFGATERVREIIRQGRIRKTEH